MHSNVPQQQVDLEIPARVVFGKLSKAEIELLHAAPNGELAVCGPNRRDDDTSNDPGKADEWGEERQIRAALLRWLCTNRESREKVDPKGLRVYGAKIIGPLELSYVTIAFPLILLRCRLLSDADLNCAELPQLILKGTWVRSISAANAKVNGSVVLNEGFHAEGVVQFITAHISGDLSCANARFENPFKPGNTESGVALNAERARVGGSVFLRNGFSALGAVRFMNAQIGGDFDCAKGTFKSPFQSGVAGSGHALVAARVIVAGGVYLSAGFQAEGMVGLQGARIGGNLVCSKGVFENPFPPGVSEPDAALTIENADVAGSVLLSAGFHARGAVTLIGTQIGVHLSCGGATFEAPAQTGVSEARAAALNLGSISIKGTVFLNNGFAAKGAVRALGAQINGTFDCSGGTFINPSLTGVSGSGTALNAGGVVVEGGCLLRNGFRAEGGVNLTSAKIGRDLDCTRARFAGGLFMARLMASGSLFWKSIVDPGLSKLELTSASVGAFDDDDRSHPAQGNLNLDGFVYGRITRNSTGARGRLRWLALHSSFAPQPYRHLAKVLRAEGDDLGARRVLCEMERLRRIHENSKRGRLARSLSSAWSAVLKVTIGYGFHPARSLLCLTALVLLDAAIFGTGYAAGSIAPTEKVAYSNFKRAGELPPHYNRFNPFVFSLENAFPLIKLGQVDSWQTDPNKNWKSHPKGWVPRSLNWFLSPWSLRRFRWLQTCLGWFLATMGVAAVSGIARRD